MNMILSYFIIRYGMLWIPAVLSLVPYFLRARARDIPRSLDPPSVGVMESQSLGLALCLEWMDVVATTILEWEPIRRMKGLFCDSLLS